MSFAWLPYVLVALNAVQGDTLEIVNPRSTYGYLGAPKMKGIGSLPGDTAFFTFDIKNLKLDENGKASYSIAIEIRDEKGKLFYQQRPYNSVAQNFLGGKTLPCSAHIEVPFDAKPGVVDWKVTIKDRTTNQVATAIGKGKILPADFGIVRVGLFADAKAQTPKSAVGVVGDNAYLRFSAIGFGRDKDGKQPDVLVSMRILDDKGNPTLAKPIVAKVNAGVDPQDRQVTMQFGITLNHAGHFTIELTAEDRLTGKRATLPYAIRVLPLE